MSAEVVNFRAVMNDWNSRAETWLVPDIVYIGRENQAYHLKASPFANPFPVKREKGETEASARRRSIEQYRDYIGRRPDLLAQLWTLRGKKLACWCYPLACHGDVLVELLNGLKPETAPSSQVGMDGSQQPVLAWDSGGAAYQIAQDKHGNLYRTSIKIAQPMGVPGKVYERWTDWYRDYLKDVLRVKGSGLAMSHEAYARFRYETRLRNMVGVEGDERMNIEAAILQELLAELDTGKEGE